MVKIRVPASTSNLGPGFDSLGLALKLYLTVQVEASNDPFVSFRFEGEGAADLGQTSEDNLIFRAMRFAAAREEVELPPARLTVSNGIPLARGLGSSGAAIIAGLSAFEGVTGRELSRDKMLAYAAEIEGHSDNVAAALLGSFVVSCVGGGGRVFAARVPWPEKIRAIAVIPEHKLLTEKARAVLPDRIPRADAVFSLQRSSLLVAAVAERRYDLIREAMRDVIHQPYRASLVPGLGPALELQDGELASVPGFLGLALSGSGPTVIALAMENFDNIASAIVSRFELQAVPCRSHVLEIEDQGRIIKGDM